MSDDDNAPQTSLYARIGGDAAVQAAVELFYTRVVADPHIAHFFGSTDMERQKEKQRGFLTMAFGGPTRYTGRNMRLAHARLVENGLNDTHFDAVLGHLDQTLAALGVGADARAEVAAIAESTRSDVLGRPAR